MRAQPSRLACAWAPAAARRRRRTSRRLLDTSRCLLACLDHLDGEKKSTVSSCRRIQSRPRAALRSLRDRSDRSRRRSVRDSSLARGPSLSSRRLRYVLCLLARCSAGGRADAGAARLRHALSASASLVRACTSRSAISICLPRTAQLTLTVAEDEPERREAGSSALVRGCAEKSVGIGGAGRALDEYTVVFVSTARRGRARGCWCDVERHFRPDARTSQPLPSLASYHQLLRPRAAHDAPLAPPAHLCRHPPPTRTRPRRLPTSLVLISPPNSTRLPSFAMSFQLSMDCQKRGRDDYEQEVSPSKRSRVRASSPLLPPPLVLPFRAPAVLLPPVSPAQLGSRASTSAPLRTQCSR